LKEFGIIDEGDLFGWQWGLGCHLFVVVFVYAQGFAGHNSEEVEFYLGEWLLLWSIPTRVMGARYLMDHRNYVYTYLLELMPTMLIKSSWD
jgi:hypothetical protein